jgi:hypothetical protein
MSNYFSHKSGFIQSTYSNQSKSALFVLGCPLLLAYIPIKAPTKPPATGVLRNDHLHFQQECATSPARMPQKTVRLLAGFHFEILLSRCDGLFGQNFFHATHVLEPV